MPDELIGPHGIFFNSLFAEEPDLTPFPESEGALETWRKMPRMTLSYLANKCEEVLILTEKRFRTKKVENGVMSINGLVEDETGKWLGPFRAIGVAGVCEGIYLSTGEKPKGHV